MVSQDKNYILMFNGEIYNHAELRSQLIKKDINLNQAIRHRVTFIFLREYGEKHQKCLEDNFHLFFLIKEKYYLLMQRQTWTKTTILLFRQRNIKFQLQFSFFSKLLWI